MAPSKGAAAGAARRRLVRPHWPSVLGGLVIAILYLAGGLDFVERYLHDLRTELTSRPASGDLVVVAIDSDSLEWLETWPWPRRYYAVVLERLLAAGATRVAFDVDFSSRSDPEDDQRLAEALEAAGPARVALPAFRQLRQARDGTLEAIDTQPLASFRRHAALVHVDFQPDADGAVRRVEARHQRVGRMVPALALWLLDEPTAAPDVVPIDFGIDARTIPRLGFADVLEGLFDPAAVAGKRVLIGTTANELGDIAAVPRYRLLPGPLVHALVFETLLQGRALGRIAGLPVAAMTVLGAWLVGWLFVEMRLRYWALSCVGLAAALVGLAGALQPLAAIVLEVSPIVLGVVVALGAGLWRFARRTDVLMHRIVDRSFDAILTFDAGHLVRSSNRAAERMFGQSARALVGEALGGLLRAPQQSGAAPPLPTQGGPHELAIVSGKDGAAVPVEAVFGAAEIDHQWVGIVALRDISERKAQQAQLRRLALHDPLTGLANRTLLGERMDQAIRAAARGGHVVAMLLLDLDRFKEVNDTLGHHVGDLLLQGIGERLQPLLRDTDTLARLGGDEFAVLLADVADQGTACLVAERVIDRLRAPFPIAELELEIGVSIGVAFYPEHATDAGALLQRADVAMYKAKRNQLGFAIYDAEDDRHSVRRLTLEGDLRRGIEGGELVLHYQPKVDVQHGHVAGVEALVRWQHPTHGFVRPDEFVQVAEQTGLIEPLTLWVLNTALGQLQDWQGRGLGIPIAVNLSVKSLQDPGLPQMLGDLLERAQIAPGRLKLEVTESALMADPANALKVLDEVAALGCQLSLDDFGTGYSSLAYLRMLPIHELKIDRSFVLAMRGDRAAATIVRSVIDLAHNLDLHVVAEGIEDQAALDQLRRLGCDQIQGYLIGRPMAIDAFERWLAGGTWSVPQGDGRSTMSTPPPTGLAGASSGV